MRVPVLISALALSLAVPAAAQEPPEPGPIESWPLEKISAMGREIHTQDVAAWVATDALLAHLGDAGPGKLAGWIVVPDGAGLLVRFVQLDDEKLTAGFDVRVVDGVAGPVVDVRDQPLSNVEQARFHARQTAIANLGDLQCTESWNSVVTSDPDGDGWLVWLLAATSRPGVVPMGGHYRFMISADGRSVMRRDQLSVGCLNMSRPPESQGRPTMMFVTHIVSDTPVETHVFLSLQTGLAIVIGVGEDEAWIVDGTAIEPFDLP